MQVRIYKPIKTPMQSGDAKKEWVMEFVTNQNSRFIDPLLGRTSSNDMMNEVKIFFDTRQGAMSFAKSKNYQIEIIEPQKSRLIKKSYAGNFCDTHT